MFLTLSFLVVFVTIFYRYCIKPHSYWRDRGVPQTKPMILVGDIPPSPMIKTNVLTLLQDIYDQAGEKRYFGFYRSLTPTLMIKDPELIKRVTVRDFDHFENHYTQITEEADSHVSQHPIMMRGQRWRDMRSLLSPSFSAAKMKGSYPLIVECTDNLIAYLQKLSNNSLQSIEMRELTDKFAIDVATTFAYGLEIDSLNDPENEFNQQVRRIGYFSWLQKIKFESYVSKNIFTNIFLFFKCPLFSNSLYSFFDDVVHESISRREREGIVRPDMINLLMQARLNSQTDSVENGLEETNSSCTTRKSQDPQKLGQRLELSNADIAAQSFIFFISALLQTSHMMSFMIYELTINEDVQDRLRKEIQETLESNNGKIDYTSLMKIEYLDMVISETLRKYPDLPFSDREVSKPYTIEPERPGEKPVHLNVGDIIWIPVFSLHHDPKYFPQPKKFIPERFSEENKTNINPYAYLPLGVGPRMCFGYRWSFLVMKIFAFYMVQNFQFVPVEKTDNPIQLGSGSVLYSKNGLWAGFKSLKKSH